MCKSQTILKIVLAFLFFTLKLNATNQYLRIFQINGQQTCVALKDNPKIECSSGYLQISVGESQISIPLCDIENFDFTNEVSSSIFTIEYDNDIDINSGHVILKSLPSNSKVCVYGINGTLLNTLYTDENGLVEFDLLKISNPIIIKTQFRSFKILNK